MNILDKLSDTPSDVNEDCWGHGDCAAWVLDGATGLGGNRFFPGPSDAHTYVETIHDAFSRFGSNSGLPLSEMVRSAIEEARRRLASFQLPENAQPYELPSASMALIRIARSRFEYATLGDCKILIQSQSGAVTMLGNSSLEALDGKVIERIKDLHAEGVRDYRDVRAQINNMLRQHRSLMNKPDGYWALSFSDEAASHMCSGSMEDKDVKRVLLLSDGFYDLVETFHLMSDETLMERALAEGLQTLLRQLREVERADPDCLRYPRLKPSDDATAVLIAL